MGNGMNKILPGLYIGNFRDSRDEEQLKLNKITHILSVHINAKPFKSDRIYFCISAHDSGTEDLSQYFEECNDFIHSARIYGGNVLVHCLAGMSRSVTVTAAYIMTVMNLGWRDALSVIRVNRECANPNFGFQKQLLAFQHERLTEEHNRLMKKYPKNPRAKEDETEIKRLLEIHKKWVLEGDKKNTSADTYPLAHRAYEQCSDGKVVVASTSSQDEETTIMTPADLCLNDDDRTDSDKEKREQNKCLNQITDPETQKSKDMKLLDEIFATSNKTTR